MNNQGVGAPVSRRRFLQGSAMCSLGAAAAGVSVPFMLRKADAAPIGITPPLAAKEAADSKVVWSACTVNCGSRCPLRMHVSGGVIQYVETDNTGLDEYGEHQVRACARGRSMRSRIYHPDRLKVPMKRIGTRGEGKFQEIEWEEAYALIAERLKKVIAHYGNEAVYLNYGTGTLGATVARSWPTGLTPIARLMNCYGGYLNHYGTYSTAQITAGLSFTYGTSIANDTADIANTRLLVMFGNNPAETRMSGGGVTYHLAEARKRSNARMIIIDPRYTDTAGGREDEWIPIRPGTDSALCAAIAHVLISEDLLDHAFLDKYCVGYDEKTLPASAPENGHYKAYILGQGADGIAKTPQWASSITGIPVDRIVKLAREIGQTKPCCIKQGWGPQRHANGENQARSIAMLAILTGNVGIQGGNSGGRESSYEIPFARLPVLQNPVTTSIPFFLWTDAIYRHQEMTDKTAGIRGAEKLKAPIKFIWNFAGNSLINQHSDVHATHKILVDENLCETIVVIDNYLTASAKYADILLPDVTTAEQADFAMDAYSGNMAYVIFADKVIEPMFKCKGIYEILSGVAAKLGQDVYDKFTEGRSQEDWLRHLYALTREKDPTLPEFEKFRKEGIIKRKNPNAYFIAHQKFRADPETNKLSTPSGKIEIYSAKLAEYAKTWVLPKGDVIHPLPVHVSTFEGWDDPARKEWPLQLVTFHFKARTHSTYGNVNILQAVSRQEVWINPLDAAPRGIKNGDLVRVFNARGETRIAAKVTPRIMPGVTALGEGAWLALDAKGIDHNGSPNVLTTLRPSPLAKGNPQHTNLVQIAKA